MRRRDLLRLGLSAGAMYGAGTLPRIGSVAHGMGFVAMNQRVLVNLMLPGGPDFRQLLPPAFDPRPDSVGYRFWQAKAAAHNLGDSVTQWQARWHNDYFDVSDGTTNFGIRNSCGWLKSMWDAGNLAVVNNVFGASTRDHVHCMRVMDQGDRFARPNDPLGSGWGGRLAAAAGGNCVALTPSPRSFGFGPAVDDPMIINNANLIAAADTRNMTLTVPPTQDPFGYEARINRSLASYYQAKRTELATDSIYHRYVELERVLREFGEPLDERLETVPVPPALQGLLQGGLRDPGFALQLRNLYDALAANDILLLRTASMDYGGWDSHRDQLNWIEPKFEDIFGTGKAFDVLYNELPADVLDNLVLVIAGEFGRQLRANGDNGTDHGVGTSVLIVGNGVNGGIYGDMFPVEELNRLADPSPDILGQTHIDHVFGAVADWVTPAGGSLAFPNRATAAAEAGLNLNQLMS